MDDKIITKDEFESLLKNHNLTGGSYTPKEKRRLKIENDLNDALRNYFGGQYKKQVYFQLNEGNNDSDIAPLSSSNIAAASNNSKFARESASRKQNHVSVEQHYQDWTNENLSEEKKSTSLFDSNGKPLSRVRGEENDDS